MTENSLIIFTRAAIMLAEADTIQKTKELKNLALTAADWAKRKGLGEEAIRYARSYALEAERKMGGMLRRTELQHGARGIGKSGVPASNSTPPSLAELGLTKRESSQAKQLFSLPEEKFEAVKTGEKTRTEVNREQRRENIIREIIEMPSDKYRVIYADPPWKYGDTRDSLSVATGASTHYPTMDISELCALPVIDLAEDNAILFLWVTSPILPKAFDIIKAWGFVYKSSFIWDKVKHNMGHYNSVRHELLLICTRGSCLPDSDKLVDSVQSIERTDKHSQKPEEFRKIIDNLYPYGNRIELFARGQLPEQWRKWGNE